MAIDKAKVSAICAKAKPWAIGAFVFATMLGVRQCDRKQNEKNIAGIEETNTRQDQDVAEQTARISETRDVVAQHSRKLNDHENRISNNEDGIAEVTATVDSLKQQVKDCCGCDKKSNAKSAKKTVVSQSARPAKPAAPQTVNTGAGQTNIVGDDSDNNVNVNINGDNNTVTVSHCGECEKQEQKPQEHKKTVVQIAEIRYMSRCY